MVRTGKVTRRGRVTSTPVTFKKSILKRKARRGKSSGMRSKRPSVSELNLVKRNLDEGLHVELSPSSNDLSQEKLELEFESTGSSLREAISNGALNTVDEVGASDIQPKRDLPAKYSNSLSNERDLPAKNYNSVDNDDERDLPAKYYNPADNDDERDSPAKYCDNLSIERDLPAKYYNTADNDDERDSPAKYHDNSVDDEEAWKDSSDPIIERVILGLTDRNKTFNNPFELSNHIREILVAQATQAGARALSWRLEDFDKIGGEGTLRSIWRDLKGEWRVHGVKRARSEGDIEEERYRKRLCDSLNMSGTCEMLENVKLLSSNGSYSTECSVERSCSETDVDQEIFLLLERTRNTRDIDLMIEEAR